MEGRNMATQIIGTDLAGNGSELVLQRNYVDKIVMRIPISHSLLFSLKCVASYRSRHKVTELILNIFESFREYALNPQCRGYKYHHRTGRTASEQLDKFFYYMYPYPLKDKVKGA